MVFLLDAVPLLLHHSPRKAGRAQELAAIPHVSLHAGCIFLLARDGRPCQSHVHELRSMLAVADLCDWLGGNDDGGDTKKIPSLTTKNLNLKNLIP